MNPRIVYKKPKTDPRMDICRKTKDCKVCVFGKDEIVNAYRALAKVHHPDCGGDKDTFMKLRKAYEEGMKQ